MLERVGGGMARLVEGLEPSDADQVVGILAGCPAVLLPAGDPHFRTSLPAVALLLVDEGFGVLRARADLRRSIITCEVGPGRLLLPPTDDEVLFGLVDSRLIAIPHEALNELLRLPAAARRLLDQLSAALAHKQEAIGNFAETRHLERVRRKLLQLARAYGRVGRDGIRIEFPVSHTVLAEMIGSSRETVTRAVDELQRRGFVARSGHTYRLLVSPREV